MATTKDILTMSKKERMELNLDLGKGGELFDLRVNLSQLIGNSLDLVNNTQSSFFLRFLRYVFMLILGKKSRNVVKSTRTNIFQMILYICMHKNDFSY